MDAVQQANSGHPGTPMALAPLPMCSGRRFPPLQSANPAWFNRDRFVLSGGHASMLQYAMLYLTGYDLSLDDLKNFRQWGSKTPGHPGIRPHPRRRNHHRPARTGHHERGRHGHGRSASGSRVQPTPDTTFVDHCTYAFCGDGDLMEGASHEAASLAGHLGLGKLICVYDDNHITIEGSTTLACSMTQPALSRRTAGTCRTWATGRTTWMRLPSAFQTARKEAERPPLIIVRSHIGYRLAPPPGHNGGPREPLGEEEVRLTKKFYGWPEDEKFLVPDEVCRSLRKAVERGRELEESWNSCL